MLATGDICQFCLRWPRSSIRMCILSGLACRASLRECENSEDLCRLVDMKDADPTAAALLIECRGVTEEDLEKRIAEVNAALKRAGLPLGRRASEPKAVEQYPFYHDAQDYNVFWDVRKGLIPIVGAAREAGACSCCTVLHAFELPLVLHPFG